MLNNYPEKVGNIVDIKTNKVLGKHNGISQYTVGQRRGLNLGGKNGYEENRWFVVEKDAKTNTLFVSNGECEQMFSTGCIVTEFNWINNKENDFECYVKLRYHQPDQKTNVEIIDAKTIKLHFNEKQRAVSIGQYAVLYAEDGTCLGGGIINEIIK